MYEPQNELTRLQRNLEVIAGKETYANATHFQFFFIVLLACILFWIKINELMMPEKMEPHIGTLILALATMGVLFVPARSYANTRTHLSMIKSCQETLENTPEFKAKIDNLSKEVNKHLADIRNRDTYIRPFLHAFNAYRLESMFGALGKAGAATAVVGIEIADMVSEVKHIQRVK